MEVPPWNGGGCAKTENTEQESGEKIAGQEFFFVQRIQFAAFAKQTGVNRRRGGAEAAAKNDLYERSDKEN